MGRQQHSARLRVVEDLALPSGSQPGLAATGNSTISVAPALKAIGSDDLAVSLSKIVDFAKLSGENLRFLATFPCFDSAIVGVLAGSTSRIDAPENTILILDSVFDETRNATVAG